MYSDSVCLKTRLLGNLQNELRVQLVKKKKRSAIQVCKVELQLLMQHMHLSLDLLNNSHWRRSFWTICEIWIIPRHIQKFYNLLIIALAVLFIVF